MRRGALAAGLVAVVGVDKQARGQSLGGGFDDHQQAAVVHLVGIACRIEHGCGVPAAEGVHQIRALRIGDRRRQSFFAGGPRHRFARRGCDTSTQQHRRGDGDGAPGGGDGGSRLPFRRAREIGQPSQ